MKLVIRQTDISGEMPSGQPVKHLKKNGIRMEMPHRLSYSLRKYYVALSISIKFFRNLF